MAEHKLALADEAMTQALDSVRKSCPQCGNELWVCASNLGLLRFEQGRYEEADRLQTEALELQYKFLARPDTETANTLQHLADVRKKQRRYDEAARYNQRAKVILAFQ
jgi:tetratricopeptide (TPR) repeat protein